MQSPTDERASDRRFGVAVDGATVVVRGDVDLHRSDQFRVALNDASRAGSAEIVIDMADVTFFDSSGLRVLINFRGRGHDLVLRSAPSSIRQILDITMTAQLFRLE